MIAAYKKNPNILEFSSLKFPYAHCTSLTAMFPELLTMKEGQYAVMLDPYGDLSHYVLRTYDDSLAGITSC